MTPTVRARKIVERWHLMQDPGDIADIAQAITEAEKAMREECAKVAEDRKPGYWTGKALAAAIRARGQG